MFNTRAEHENNFNIISRAGRPLICSLTWNDLEIFIETLNLRGIIRPLAMETSKFANLLGIEQDLLSIKQLNASSGKLQPLHQGGIPLAAAYQVIPSWYYQLLTN